MKNIIILFFLLLDYYGSAQVPFVKNEVIQSIPPTVEPSKAETYIIREGRHYYEVQFWPSGNLKLKSRVEVYFVETIFYLEDMTSGNKTTSTRWEPGYRYNGKSVEYDENGISVLYRRIYRKSELIKERKIYGP